MPNVLLLPRSADYNEEVWMEIREKDIYIPKNAVSEGGSTKSAPLCGKR